MKRSFQEESSRSKTNEMRDGLVEVSSLTRNGVSRMPPHRRRAPSRRAGVQAEQDARMTVRFWGVRGSIPSPGPQTCRYGGNTACVEVRAAEELLILDAGTGIRQLGLALNEAGGPIRGTILISHAHWDHIHGLPYFAPAMASGNRFKVYGCTGTPAHLRSILA